MLGIGMFDRPGVYYSNNPKNIFNDEWFLDQDKINNLKQHNLAIINFSSEHYGVDGIDYVYHALDSAGINFLLLSHDPGDHQKFDRMLFYPHWYHWSKENFVMGKNNPVKKYKWSCLNGNPRLHRVYNYFYSQKQPYFNSAYFTFHNNEIFRHDDVTIPEDAINFWNAIKDSMPGREMIDEKQLLRPDSRCDLPATTDSYVHLVTETTVIPRMFVSEKTWKPVASGQLFLVFGNPRTVEYLRNQGVDVFDDIIDHSYDLVEDWQHRLHLIHNQLKLLIEKNLEDIYIATLARRQSNVEKFFSGRFDSQYQQTLTQRINQLLEIEKE